MAEDRAQSDEAWNKSLVRNGEQLYAIIDETGHGFAEGL